MTLMRKCQVIAAVFSMLSFAASRPGSAGISGTKHDFTATGGSPVAGVTELCASCHVPHRPLINAPLWSHALSSATYVLYNQNADYKPSASVYNPSPETFEGTPTKLCLSCHDGSVAVAGNAFLTSASQSWIMNDNGPAAAPSEGGQNYRGLLGSHPVGVTMGGIQHNGGDCSKCHNFRGKPPTIKFYNNKVQCTTCHNPHMRVPGTKFLVMSNENSALCTTCHRL